MCVLIRPLRFSILCLLSCRLGLCSQKREEGAGSKELLMKRTWSHKTQSWANQRGAADSPDKNKTGRKEERLTEAFKATLACWLAWRWLIIHHHRNRTGFRNALRWTPSIRAFTESIQVIDTGGRTWIKRKPTKHFCSTRIRSFKAHIAGNPNHWCKPLHLICSQGHHGGHYPRGRDMKIPLFEIQSLYFCFALGCTLRSYQETEESQEA